MPQQQLISGSIVQNGAGTSAPFIVGPAWNAGGALPTFPQYDKSIGLAACIQSGAPSYTVQVTCNQNPLTTTNWVNHAILQNQMQSMYGDISEPVTGIRLVVTGTGVVNLDMCRWC